MLIHGELTERILNAAIEVHKEIGPGVLEPVYEEALCDELTRRHIPFQQQVTIPIRYKGRLLNGVYRIDLLVENRVIVELKSVDRVLPVFEAQLLTYLRLTGLRVGLLL